MSEFSTKAMVDIEVSEKSLRDARSTVQNRVGSVRTDGGTATASASPARDSQFLADRASKERAMTRNLLAAQLEALGDIKELLQKQGLSEAQSGDGGGGGIGTGMLLSGLIGGGSAAGTIGGIAAGVSGSYGLNEIFGEISSDQIAGLGGGASTQGAALGASLGLGAARGLGFGEEVDELKNLFSDPPTLGLPNASDIPNLNLPSPEDIPDLNLPGPREIPELNLPRPKQVPELNIPSAKDLPKLNLEIPTWVQRVFNPDQTPEGGDTGTQAGDDTTSGRNQARERKQASVNLGVGPIAIDAQDLERQIEDALQGGQVDIERMIERKVDDMVRGL